MPGMREGGGALMLFGALLLALSSSLAGPRVSLGFMGPWAAALPAAARVAALLGAALAPALSAAVAGEAASSRLALSTAAPMPAHSAPDTFHRLCGRAPCASGHG